MTAVSLDRPVAPYRAMVANSEADYRALNLCGKASEKVRTLMGACIGPRPIALVTTIGPDGVTNAAPYSNFMGVGTEPPLIALALGRKNGEEKDTLLNLREHGVFTVNTVSVGMADAMHHTAAEYRRTQSEVGPAGLHTLPGAATDVPRIAEAPIHLECKVYQIVEIGAPVPNNWIVIGEVLRVHVRRDLLRPDGTLDAEAWDPLGGIGDSYVTPGDVFGIPYPTPVE